MAATGKPGKGKRHASHGKKKHGEPSLAKNKKFSEQQGLAHMIALSAQIASKKDEQQRQLLERAQARREKAQEEKPRHGPSLVEKPVKSDLNRVKAQIQEKKRERRRQRKENRKAEQRAESPHAPSPAMHKSSLKTAEVKSKPKAKPRKSVSFAV